jgi:hypothetical protein
MYRLFLPGMVAPHLVGHGKDLYQVLEHRVFDKHGITFVSESGALRETRSGLLVRAVIRNSKRD